MSYRLADLLFYIRRFRFIDPTSTWSEDMVGLGLVILGLIVPCIYFEEARTGWKIIYGLLAGCSLIWILYKAWKFFLVQSRIRRGKRRGRLSEKELNSLRNDASPRFISLAQALLAFFVLLLWPVIFLVRGFHRIGLFLGLPQKAVKQSTEDWLRGYLYDLRIKRQLTLEQENHLVDIVESKIKSDEFHNPERYNAFFQYLNQKLVSFRSKQYNWKNKQERFDKLIKLISIA